MPIDVDAALDADDQPAPVRWTDQDVLLYHLAVGAGADPTDPAALSLAYERDLVVLPTFAVVAGTRARSRGLNDRPGIDVDLRRLLHGEQEVEVHRAIPPEGSGTATTRVLDVWDKGKAAVIRMGTEVLDDAGAPLWTTRMSLFVRGEGGFGGNPGPSGREAAPEGLPDHRLRVPTRPDQALLYRLTGDRNPLHVDPEFAAAAGFERPILHGLCTYGMVCREVVRKVLDGRVDAIHRYAARFAGVVLPGESLDVSVWAEPGRLRLSATTAERGDPVLTDAVIDLN